MRPLARLAGTAALVATAVLTTAGMASAMPAPELTATTSSTVQVTAFSVTLPSAFLPTMLPDFSCPDDHPYLESQVFAADPDGAGVPAGVALTGDPNVTVSITSRDSDPVTGALTGWSDDWLNEATSPDAGAHLTAIAFCTDDLSNADRPH